MYFSPQGEKIPKELLRLPPQTLILLPESSSPRLEDVAVLARLAQAITRCAEGLCHWEPAPAGARRAPCERLPVRCSQKGRRLTDHANKVSVDAVFYSRHRTAAGCINGQARGLQFF